MNIRSLLPKTTSLNSLSLWIKLAAIAIPPRENIDEHQLVPTYISITTLFKAKGNASLLKKNDANIAFRYSILFTLSLEDVLHLNILNSSFMVASFYNFVNGLLNNMNSFPLYNLVVVMDNVSIHHAAEV